MSDEERESQHQEGENVLDGEHDVATLGVVESLDYQRRELREPELEATKSLLTGTSASSKGVITGC